MNCSQWRESFIAVLSGAAITPHLRDLMDDHLSDCDACEARDHMTCEQFQRWEPQIYTAGFMNILQLQCRNHEEDCAACADWSTRRYLKERGVDDPDAYPCLHVALHSLHTCEEHDDAWQCPDTLLVETGDGGFGLPIRDGGPALVPIHFCPWCGVDLKRPLQ